jgi:hypothetical protein
LIFLLLLTKSVGVWAQESGGGGEMGDHQVSVFAGRILPKSIDGVTEIFSVVGGRYSQSFKPGGLGFWELGLLGGNSEGVRWQSGFASLRLDAPVDPTLSGLVYLGLDVTKYRTDSGESKSDSGLHFGGGLMALIGGAVSARLDMKLGAQPGSTLLFSLGIVASF